MADKSFDQIMWEITAGLSGDSQKDCEYLQEQMDKYKDHKYCIEITRACGRLLYETLPEEKKEKLEKLVNNDSKGFDAALEEVRFNQYKKNYDKALELIEAMVKKYEDLAMYKDDEVSEYHCFNEPMEEMLYREDYKPQKDVRRAQVKYDALYLQYGSSLFDLQRLEDAEKALAKGMRWNPSSTGLAFEHAETFKARGLIDDFGRLTKDIFKIAYRPGALARCYRNMAYYFVEMKEYKAAVCCLLLSTGYEKSEFATSELYYISQVTGEVYEPSREELRECLESCGVPFGPRQEILEMAYSAGMYFYKQGDNDTAAYFLNIVSQFVDDEEINEILEKIMPKEE